MTKEFWLRFRGSRTWHKVMAATKAKAIKKFLKGTTFTKKDVISRKTRPLLKNEGASIYRIPRR